MNQTLAMSQTWLLTGIPRSGTSLCCRLAGTLPDTVALSEPMPNVSSMVNNPRSALTHIKAFVQQTRAQIIADRRAPSIHVKGCLYDNIVVSHRTVSGLRQRQDERGEILVDKPVSTRFTLVIRHNGLFAALLPRLISSFSCFAVVRNPLALLASWQTVDLPIQQGRLPGGEMVDRELHRVLQQESEVLQRQIIVLKWLFKQYQEHLPPTNIVRYEDLIDCGGLTLFRLLGHPEVQPAILSNRNHSVLYDKATIFTLLEALMKAGGPWKKLYSFEDCKEVAEGIWHGG